MRLSQETKKMTVSRLAGAFTAIGLALLTPLPSSAAELLSGFGGPRGYGDEFLSRNDDESTSEIPLPFSVDFFGQTYSSFFVNNNGNVTFGRELSDFTPEAFPLSGIPNGGGGGDGEGGGELLTLLAAETLVGTPIIAPYWADVDTRALREDGSNLVWVHSPNANTVVVTWDEVGYYDSKIDKTNDFQLVLRNRADTGQGNFDIDFRYRSLQWTTGDASDGINGLGGIPAQAGFDAGNGINFLMLPGSRTDAILEIQDTSNVAADTPGLWTFAVRNGALPDGATPSNPLLPIVTENGWEFTFNIEELQRIFIDPEVAIGYDYIVDSGPNIASILLPSIGDGIFDLWLWSGSEWVDSGQVITAGDVFTFASGQQRVRILGIEMEANLDPSNTTAFVTGLTFDAAGQVSMRQIPITAAIPEPETWAMMAIGLVVLVAGSRRARRTA
jgi:hypothetical protein